MESPFRVEQHCGSIDPTLNRERETLFSISPEVIHQHDGREHQPVNHKRHETSRLQIAKKKPDA